MYHFSGTSGRPHYMLSDIAVQIDWKASAEQISAGIARFIIGLEKGLLAM